MARNINPVMTSSYTTHSRITPLWPPLPAAAFASISTPPEAAHRRSRLGRDGRAASTRGGPCGKRQWRPVRLAPAEARAASARGGPTGQVAL